MGGSHPTEVEIRRKFEQPHNRLKAMDDFHAMCTWLENNAYKCGLLMCRIEGDEIVWKFGGTWTWSDPVAVEFNRLFDEPKPSTFPYPSDTA